MCFSWKDHIKFKDCHMKIELPFRVYADFECLNMHVADKKIFLQT